MNKDFMLDKIDVVITNEKGEEFKVKGFTTEKTESIEEISDTNNTNPKITKINPVEFLKKFNNENELSKTLSKIHFDKNLETDIIVTKEFSCDGTFALIFSQIMQGIEEALQVSPLHVLAYSPEKVDIENHKDLKYTFGEITLETNYEPSDFPIKEHNIVTIPVKCEFV